jgi:(E)-4-hydroxy-3-methylbut-2-enyl-diphosphate synthase
VYARIKSTTGIGTLLAEGIGDTIRVSLAEDPVNELPVCYDILQALGLRRTKTEFIACPSCGRTKFDLPTVLAQVKAATGHLAGLNIAVMGCIVNGPGEMADADYGYVGKAGGKISLYRGREEVKSGIPQERGVQELIDLLKADGTWEEPADGYTPPEPTGFNSRITVQIPLAVK